MTSENPIINWSLIAIISGLLIDHYEPWFDLSAESKLTVKSIVSNQHWPELSGLQPEWWSTTATVNNDNNSEPSWSHIALGALTWKLRITIFDRWTIYKWEILHFEFSFPEGNHSTTSTIAVSNPLGTMAASCWSWTFHNPSEPHFGQQRLNTIINQLVNHGWWYFYIWL